MIVRTSESSHWYTPDGKPCYEVPYAEPGKGMRPTTLRDAKRLGLLPSVTTILKCLHKQALVDWLIEQACRAVLAAPRNESEPLDDFIHRVLNVEKQQDQEAQKARELGTRIHDALEKALNGVQCPQELLSYVNPVLDAVNQLGRVIATEEVLVGEGYAGKMDALFDGDSITVVDFKTSKTVPTRSSYLEHRVQTAAYAAALGNTGDRLVRTANVYISTKEPGLIAMHIQDDWQDAYWNGFVPIANYWRWANGLTANTKG